jgi:hypothetical protein
MAPIVLRGRGGTVSGPVSIGKLHWANPARGTLRMTDGFGNLLASMAYSGSGQEPTALLFNPPLQSSSGVNVSHSGGDVHLYLQGASGAGLNRKSGEEGNPHRRFFSQSARLSVAWLHPYMVRLRLPSKVIVAPPRPSV